MVQLVRDGRRERNRIPIAGWKRAAAGDGRQGLFTLRNRFVRADPVRSNRSGA